MLSGGVKTKCDGLNKNVPHRLICLNTWSADGNAVWAGLGSMALGSMPQKIGFVVSQSSSQSQ